MYLKVPLFYIEDVHTSGFLAEICNIPRRHFPHFVYGFNMTSMNQNLVFLNVTHFYTYHYSRGNSMYAPKKLFPLTSHEK